MKWFKNIIALLICLSAAQAENVIFLLAPEAGAPVVARVNANDSAIKNASDVLGSEPDNNAWKWIDYPVTLVGYVPTMTVGKNFAIADGTLVYSEQTNNSDILSIIEAEDVFIVLESNEKWTKVRGTKEIPVYFSRLPQLGLTSLSEIEMATITPSYQMSTEPMPQIRNAHIDHMAPEPSPELTDIMVESNIQTKRSAPKSPGEMHGIPTRTMAGKLVRRYRNYGPRYPLRLLSPSGNRIAYIDISRIFISDLRPYLDQQIHISGEVRPLVPGSRELVIFARTIRLSN